MTISTQVSTGPRFKTPWCIIEVTGLLEKLYSVPLICNLYKIDDGITSAAVIFFYQTLINGMSVLRPFYAL